MKQQDICATGRRKTAVASVRLRHGGRGQITINHRALEDYFPLELQRKTIMAPFSECNIPVSYDILINVKGGGIEAQVVAARLGIARALVSQDEGRKADLKALGFLTRDARKKERKKYGQKGARKRFQFSKR